MRAKPRAESGRRRVPGGGALRPSITGRLSSQLQPNLRRAFGLAHAARNKFYRLVARLTHAPRAQEKGAASFSRATAVTRRSYRSYEICPCERILIESVAYVLRPSRGGARVSRARVGSNPAGGNAAAGATGRPADRSIKLGVASNDSTEYRADPAADNSTPNICQDYADGRARADGRTFAGDVCTPDLSKGTFPFLAARGALDAGEG
ncbi:hypothetical protein EVAR_93049_1 [Eumeta japonica]|uniref:Uncharacterized protein n=1 Tax=Eumeta variegata TaxID=151549 RepID=A0A4C1TG40_EUMVA|nr:hypothetical protein EVAR_93049_1 [Eumeta japonica]